MHANPYFRYRYVTFSRSYLRSSATVVAAIVLAEHNDRRSGRRSGGEFFHSSGDDDADDRNRQSHRCPIWSRRYRRGSRPDPDIAIGEHLEVVIRSAHVPQSSAIITGSDNAALNGSADSIQANQRKLG
jgi:hypothetical protein